MVQDSKPKNRSSFFLIIVVLVFAVLLGVSVHVLSTQSKKSTVPRGPSPTPLSKTNATPEITSQEQQAIEKWIRNNNLNQYGDKQDTNYIGGTPLYDESTESSLNRFEYIIKNHPDRPWTNDE